MNKKELIKVSTYARLHGISVQTVYNKIKKGELKAKVIDDVKFVKVKDE